MGYDLHITRRKCWFEEANDIAAQACLNLISNDPDLTLSNENSPFFARWSGPSDLPDPWLDWHDGVIYSKNPDPALIDKMVAIAHHLHAQVQGDDGEIYRSGHEPPSQLRPSLTDRVRRAIRALRPVKRLAPVQFDFAVGDRVRDSFRQEATVLEIDPQANHGLGKVRVDYGNGRVVTWALRSAHLTRVSEDCR